jgi:hypothetical protein
MKTLERLNKIGSRIKKHPDYKNTLISYHQAVMINERYAIATDKYYPGESSVSREERDTYYHLIKGGSNISIFYFECMKTLLTEEERKDDCQDCLDIFRKIIRILKKQLLTYEGFDRVRFAHDILCFMEIPHANLKEYDPDGFLNKLFDLQVRKMKNMKRQGVHEGLSDYFYTEISKLDPNVFSDAEILPAAIILEAYQNNDMKGMKNARYFSAVASNELGEIIDDDTTAEIVRKLITHGHIKGEVDGKYHFLIRD